LLSMLMKISCDLVDYWLSYMELKVWMSKCLSSILLIHGLFWLNDARSVMYVARAFDWYHFYWILEKISCVCTVPPPSSRRRRWFPP
jgi:hypothetical protein